jgi:hypothetical protein
MRSVSPEFPTRQLKIDMEKLPLTHNPSTSRKPSPPFIANPVLIDIICIPVDKRRAL